MTVDNIVVRQLGLQDYQTIWERMQQFTLSRDENTTDEIWLLEHYPVYTLGRNGKEEHILAAGNIPVIHIDRGGQVTYHGPGQLVAYLLIDIRRRALGARALVSAIENGIIKTLAEYNLNAYAKKTAPGVYIDNAKIAALGLRIQRGCSFHGLSLNIDMDLSPFEKINPCGYKGLQITQLAAYMDPVDYQEISDQLLNNLTHFLNYHSLQRYNETW